LAQACLAQNRTGDMLTAVGLGEILAFPSQLIDAFWLQVLQVTCWHVLAVSYCTIEASRV